MNRRVECLWTQRTKDEDESDKAGIQRESLLLFFKIMVC